MTRQMSDAPIPAPPYPVGRLGERIERVLQRALGMILNSAKSLLSEIFAAGIELVLESLETVLAQRAAPIIDSILQTPNLPPEVSQYLNHLKTPTAQADALGLTGLTSGIASGAASAFLAPIMRVINYTLEEKFHTMRPDLSLAYAVKWRVPAADYWMNHSLLETGWAPDWFPWLEETIRPRLNPSELIAWALHTSGSPDSIRDELSKFGFASSEIDRLFKLAEVIPGPNDLVAMAVKEAWNDSFAALTGADQDLPGEFVEWGKKVGLSADWCRRYWRAHWELPSSQMGFEMLHRGVISEAQLDQLLKALDISPFWRPLLRQIAYNPYTRVDIRRMYNMGILNREQVKRSYLDGGYDDEHAENLTKFTVDDATGTDKDATKSDILAGYSSALLSRDEAIDWLIKLDYPRDLAEFYISKEDAKKAQSRKAKRIASIQRLYIGGEIGAAEASTRLTALGLSGAEIQEYMDDWTIERESKTERPSAAQLEAFLKGDVITESEYRDGLKFLGFQSQYIEWFASSALDEKAKSAQDAERAARAEQDRLRTARARSDYAIAKAALDVSISECQSAIANIQVAASARRLEYQRELSVAKRAVSSAQLTESAQADIASLQAQLDGLAKTGDEIRETITQENSAIDASREALAALAIDINDQIKAASDPAIVSQLKAQLKDATLSSNHEIAQHQTIIGEQEQDLAALSIQEVDIKGSIDARKTKLQTDLAIAERVRSIAEIESEYKTDASDYNTRLGDLQAQLLSLRKQIAQLAVTLQAAIKPGG